MPEQLKHCSTCGNYYTDPHTCPGTGTSGNGSGKK